MRGFADPAPQAHTTFEHAAIEHHARAPIAGVRTIGWDETCLPPPHGMPRCAPALGPDHVPWPAVRAIVALGVTYRSHIAETGGNPDEGDGSFFFPKERDTWLPDGAHVEIPASEALLSALDAIEPGISSELRKRYGFLPALMDYEAELGLVVLEDGALGYFVANDLTARSCQIRASGAVIGCATGRSRRASPGSVR